MKNKSEKLINQYRTQLMGIATIGVLLVHSKNVVQWPRLFNNFCSYGGTGVYIFVFLSAIGLYYSLQRGGAK